MNNARSFSHNAAAYARHRPRYPAALFDFLREACPRHTRAWDCATGNGQAAVACARHFDFVAATDVSLEQVRHGQQHPRVAYSVASAEAIPFGAHTFDLITVAQAIHWFDLPAFFREVERVLRPGGLLAAWAYNFPQIAPAIDAILQRELYAPIDSFWAEGNRMVINRYRDLHLPYGRVPAPTGLHIRVEWTLPQFLAYLRTWSAVKRYIAERGRDPVAHLETALAPHWGAPEIIRLVRMRLFIKASRKPNR